MKNLIYAFCFLFVAPLFADSMDHRGLYQVDTTRSMMVMGEVKRNLSGSFDIKEYFPETKLILAYGDVTFESSQISGTMDNFEAKGLIRDGFRTSEISFQGKFVNEIRFDDGSSHVIFNLRGKDCLSSVTLTRKLNRRTALHSTVEDIIR